MDKFIVISCLFILYIFLVVLNIPITPFITIYSSALLGTIETIIYIFLTSSIGVYFSLIVNRYFNNKIKFIKNNLSKMNLLFRPKVIYIILLQIIPIIPFSWIIIYVSNTNFSPTKFIFAYCIGCLFPISLSAYLGKSIIENDFFTFVIIFTIIILLIISSKIINTLLKNK